MKALCSSIKCCNEKNLSFSKMRVLDVSKGVTNCPYCGSVIFWKKETKKNNRKKREFNLNEGR